MDVWDSIFAGDASLNKLHGVGKVVCQLVNMHTMASVPSCHTKHSDGHSFHEQMMVHFVLLKGHLLGYAMVVFCHGLQGDQMFAVLAPSQVLSRPQTQIEWFRAWVKRSPLLRFA